MVIRDHAVALRKDQFTIWLPLAHATISNGRHWNLIKALTARWACLQVVLLLWTTKFFAPATTQPIMRANSPVAVMPALKAKSSACPATLPVPTVFYSSCRRFQRRRAFTSAQIWLYSKESLLTQWPPWRQSKTDAVAPAWMEVSAKMESATAVMALKAHSAMKSKKVSQLSSSGSSSSRLFCWLRWHYSSRAKRSRHESISGSDRARWGPAEKRTHRIEADWSTSRTISQGVPDHLAIEQFQQWSE